MSLLLLFNQPAPPTVGQTVLSGRGYSHRQLDEFYDEFLKEKLRGKPKNVKKIVEKAVLVLEEADVKGLLNLGTAIELKETISEGPFTIAVLKKIELQTSQLKTMLDNLADEDDEDDVLAIMWGMN